MPPAAAALATTAERASPLTRATVTTAAPIFIVPDSARQPLRVAATGTTLNVLKEDGDWTQVQFADPQWGPRTGWIEAKFIRISRPDLQPMDLSIRNEPDPALVTAAPAYAQQLPASNAGSRLQSRKGFWFNAGLGFGSQGCQNCDGYRENGLSGGLSLGTAVTDRLMLGVGTTGYSKSLAGEIFSVGTLDARLRFYPKRTSGFNLTTGLGLGSMSYGGESEIGLGLMLGVGWDIRVARNVSISPFWNGFAMANSNVDSNVGQLGIGITIH